MKDAKYYRESYPNKTDEQIINSLAWELSDKVETIHNLLKQKSEPILTAERIAEMLPSDENIWRVIKDIRNLSYLYSGNAEKERLLSKVKCLLQQEIERLSVRQDYFGLFQ